MASANELAAKVMEHLCACKSHGYTQGYRWGDGGFEAVQIAGSTYTIETGDRDCSSAVISCYKAIGIDCGGAEYTGDMRIKMCSTGCFEWLNPKTPAVVGDIYVNEAHHAAMCVSTSPFKFGQFSSSEHGTAFGSTGDQTGKESLIVDYYDYPWDGIIRYSGGNGATAPAPAKPVVRYRVRTIKSGWLPELVEWDDSGPLGDDYAGNPGEPIVYIAIGMNGWYQARSESAGWLPVVRGYDVGDLVDGCAGDGSPITGIRCYYETPRPDITGWLSIEYQVARIGCDWSPPMKDVSSSDPEQDWEEARPIDRFRAKLVSS